MTIPPYDPQNQYPQPTQPYPSMPPGAYTPYPAPSEMMSPSDQRLWATLGHVGALFFGFLVPLVTYLVLKDRGAFVRSHAAASLNFQLTLIIGYLAGFVLIFVLVGILVLLALPILNLIFCIIAAVRANSGEPYSYPLTIRFVS